MLTRKKMIMETTDTFIILIGFFNKIFFLLPKNVRIENLKIGTKFDCIKIN